jgi:hypothetical protein
VRRRPDSVLLRLVDDWLVITTSGAAAQAVGGRLCVGRRLSGQSYCACSVTSVTPYSAFVCRFHGMYSMHFDACLWFTCCCCCCC